MHDWTVNGNSIKGTASVEGQWVVGSAPTLAGMPAAGIDLTIPVSNLKSTESSSMDNTMYDALNSKKFPNITYHLTSADLKSAPTKADPAYHFAAVGQLTISGEANAVNLDLAVLPQAYGQLKVTTSTSLKMSDYGIKPPTAMLGMIKSGDAVTVKVTWQLSEQPAPQATPATNPASASAQ
jgi:polyisoprenoid-binding protein YceI